MAVKYTPELKKEASESKGAKKLVTIAVGDLVFQGTVETKETIPLVKLITSYMEIQSGKSGG